jgi:hypothetical protein
MEILRGVFHFAQIAPRYLNRNSFKFLAMADEKEGEITGQKQESGWMPSIWVFFGEDE